MKNSTTTKPDFKIKLESQSQFLRAWNSLIKLGYDCDRRPHTVPYLYGYSDGHIGVDYFDCEGADLSNPNTAFACFKDHKNPEITLNELEALAEHYEIWSKAPQEAFHWERLLKGKCIWHCRENERTFDKKAPNFKVERNSSWRDTEKQKEADEINANINKRLRDLNIVLA